MTNNASIRFIRVHTPWANQRDWEVDDEVKREWCDQNGIDVETRILYLDRTDWYITNIQHATMFILRWGGSIVYD